MKIEKRVLSEVLRVLSKVARQTSPEMAQRSIRFVGSAGNVRAMATDGVEVVLLKMEAECTGEIDFSVELGQLREIARTAKGELELDGAKLDWPQVEVVPEEALTVELQEDFCEMLKLAAPIVDLREVRRTLQGINLCKDGITVTDGKQLLHLPQSWKLEKSVILPFPHALLAAKPKGRGKLYLWDEFFKIEIDDFSWIGKLIAGNYPNWQQIMTPIKDYSYVIEFDLDRSGQITEFLKKVPDSTPHHGVELWADRESLSLQSLAHPEIKTLINATYSGQEPTHPVVINKYGLRRLLELGHYRIHADQSGRIPVTATGGHGTYVIMPIFIPNQPIEPKKEETKMEETTVVTETVNANPMDELNLQIDQFRNNLKGLLDESAVLSRKVKEAMLQQKQKEREFVQARKAIERIRLASGF